jgi:hypothetical protein
VAWTTPIRNNNLLRLFQSKDDMASFPPQEPSDAQRKQEMLLEDMALKGADRISKMSIPERAKRAMLAEAIEDRIFELTEVLEGFVDKDGMVQEQNREKAIEVARQVKQFQKQYSDMVRGEPSSLLQTLDSVGRGSEEE